MTFSLNEIEAMSKRAARGAGLPWGLAEEAGKAVRWLTANGFPGPETLAALLTRNDGRPYVQLAPASADDDIWRPPSASDRLCPLATGAALCDRAAEIVAGRAITLGATMRPLLLAPFAAGVTEMTGATVRLSWVDTVLIFAPTDVHIEGDRGALTVCNAEGIQCRRAQYTGTGSAQIADTARHDVDSETWSRLNAFATRIFAPATEASRLTGAGGGSSDHD